MKDKIKLNVVQEVKMRINRFLPFRKTLSEDERAMAEKFDVDEEIREAERLRKIKEVKDSLRIKTILVTAYTVTNDRTPNYVEADVDEVIEKMVDYELAVDIVNGWNLELASRIPKIRLKMLELARALRENHLWHQEYDLHKEYEGSELCKINTEALASTQASGTSTYLIINEPGCACYVDELLPNHYEEFELGWCDIYDIGGLTPKRLDTDLKWVDVDFRKKGETR